MAKFYPNDGRNPIEVSSTDDIKAYMGDIMDSFSEIQIEGDTVMTSLKGQYISIGKLQK